MLLDQYSLLAAIVFSGSALGVTLLLSWATSRAEGFLLTWSCAMALVVIGVILFGLLDRGYDPALQCASFIALIAGFTLIHFGALQFRYKEARWRVTAALGLMLVAPVLVAFLLGYSGVGTILANLALATLLFLSGAQYWAARAEAPFPMAVNTLLYHATAFTFLLCCVPLIGDQHWTLQARPINWAEDINSIFAIIGLTGIGAVSLALNQTRIARRHHVAAMTDSLTGLLNRRALFDRMGKSAIEPGTAAMVLDLDHFKSINDQHGHAGGDIVLTHFAAIVRERVASCDFAARTGGEEFCIIMPDTSARLAMRLAEDIRASLSVEPVAIPGGTVRATVSIGVAFCTGASESFDALLERADRALYTAKKKGRNQVQSSGLRIIAA